MTFRDRACAHLSDYRENVLGVSEGTFNYRGRSIRKGHILPKASLCKNILEPYRDQFFMSEHGSIKLHKYFHHLNSSQALCINFFFPFLVEHQQDLLVRALRVNIRPPFQPTFEFPSTLEVASRRTSFDFHLSSPSHQVYVEVKYTEDGFGEATDDDEHRQKFKDTYLPLLRRSSFITRTCHDRGFFFHNYQVLRNLVHITETSEVVFLMPKHNRVAAEQAEEARSTFLTASGQERLHIVYLEDAVRYLTDNCRNGALATYFPKFRDKYLGFAN